MFSKAKKTERIDPEQREQFEYARSRMSQKKRLMRHFIVFLAGAVFLIILNPILRVGKDFFIKDWFVWAILIWAFLFLIHVFEVFIVNTFMGKEWEDRQLENLKARQEERLSEMKQQLEKDEVQLPEKRTETHNPLPPDVE
jgi:type VI protein secretion system component VasK